MFCCCLFAFLLLKRNDTRNSVYLTKCVCAVSLCGCKLWHQQTVYALCTKQSMFFDRRRRCRCRSSCVFSKQWTLCNRGDGDGIGGPWRMFHKKECFKWRENHLPPTFFHILIGIDSIQFCVRSRTITTITTNDFPFLVFNGETSRDRVELLSERKQDKIHISHLDFDIRNIYNLYHSKMRWQFQKYKYWNTKKVIKVNKWEKKLRPTTSANFIRMFSA